MIILIKLMENFREEVTRTRPTWIANYHPIDELDPFPSWGEMKGPFSLAQGK
jgi:hypothetical protein